VSYRIVIEKRAEKFIRKQTSDNQARILTAIYRLPSEGDIKPLEDSKENFRLRVGSFRVIYTVEHEIITVRVLEVGNRGQIYNRY
jgi:mRNA interferase RelE/StbE